MQKYNSVAMDEHILKFASLYTSHFNHKHSKKIRNILRDTNWCNGVPKPCIQLATIAQMFAERLKVSDNKISNIAALCEYWKTTHLYNLTPI